MTSPRFWRNRPRFNGSPSDHDDTQYFTRLRTGEADGATWPAGPGHVTFGGANDIGLPDGAYVPYKCLRCQKDDHCEGATVNCDCPCTGAAAARLRAQPRYQPPQQPPPAGYSATTGPMPALGRPAVSIGDDLARDDTWGPKLTPLPCGHCGTAPPVPGWILERTRIIGHVNWLAARAGWAFDYDMTWTCPPCQQGETWRARQGQVELHRFDEPCDRHDAPPWADVDPDECRCTCPGAVVAVDVMLTSEDHLGSGRGRHTAVTR